MPDYFKFTNKADVLEIDIEGEIGKAYDWWNDTVGTTKEQVAEKLKEIANSAASRIIVNINSLGGDVNHGISIHDALASHKAKVTTKVNGMTASAATIIAMAADPGQREISANSLFLVHRASTFAFGNQNMMKGAVSDLEKVDGRIVDIYAKRTGRTAEEVNAMMDRFDGRGEWLTPEEAKDFGFVDTIIEPMKAAAYVENLGRIGLPEIPLNKIKMTKETVKAWFEEFMQNFKPKEEPVNHVEIKIMDQQEVLTKLEELAGEVEQKTSDLAAKTGEVETLTATIADLWAKIITLEDQIAKQKGVPTATKEKDDPALELHKMSNQQAHDKNAESLKS